MIAAALVIFMQHISDLVPQSNPSRGGGRVASAAYRYSLDQCEDFSGLEEGVNRYDLLLLVKRTGKLAGFTPRMIHLLDYYMAFTREIDWEEGSRPIVYQSLARTSLDLGVTERQIQKLEHQLFTVGAITFNDSGNHRRYGQRDSNSGRILYAYGVDLTPLAYLKLDLEEIFQEKQLHDQAWMETKRQISWYRRQIRSSLLEIEEEGTPARQIQILEAAYDKIAIQLRTHIDLEQLRSLLERHRELHSDILEAMKVNTPPQVKPSHTSNRAETTQESSCGSEQQFVHYKLTTHKQLNTSSPADSGFQEKRSEPSVLNDPVLASGLQHIKLKQVLLAASERFRAFLPLEQRLTGWTDVVEAAFRLRTDLHISQRSWAEACDTLGRAGASICVLITDRATERPKNPVRQPAAYFQGMINRSRTGELRLHNSVFGLLQNFDAKETA